MATLPAVQRQGYGAALVRFCIARIHSLGATLLWCHGRTSALPFYYALGFVTHGDEFVTPDTGPHYLCVRIIDMQTEAHRIAQES
jgi:GNAT superfamily N-acetyltransferase